LIITDTLLQGRAEDPVRVGIAGPGFMARGLINHITNTTTGMSVAVVYARTPEKGVAALENAGIAADRIVVVETAEDIDAAMELGYKHPSGPLRTTDIVGLDVRLHIAEYLASQLGERFAPPQILRDKVAAGELGRKTGKGFYNW